MTGLPEGFSIAIDSDGDAWLIPPEAVTIFSEPGEGWLITDDFMEGRDWESPSDLEDACVEYLAGVLEHEAAG